MESGGLLERGELLAALTANLEAAAAGRGAMLFLGGEAGIGKTSLVREFTALAAPRARVVSGACDAMGTPRALGPLLDMAAAVGGELDEALRHAGRRDRIFDLFLTSLDGATGPTVAVFEDVHWADDATLDLLRFLARRLETRRTVAIATYRDDEVGPYHPLRSLLGDLATAAAVKRLTVPPLSMQAVAQLADGSGLDPAELHRVTAGNPFFATEVIAAGGDGVPATVRDVVAARAARLPPEGRSALELASVLGPRSAAAQLEALGVSAEGVEACTALGLLQEARGGVEFRHELARSAVYLSLSSPRRQALHRAVLGLLEQEPAAAVDLAALAHHAAAAGAGAAVLRHAPAAGSRASRLGAHKEAHAQYARALRFAGALPAAERAELLERYAGECDIVDQLSESIRARTEAAELLREGGAVTRLGLTLGRLAGSYMSMGNNAAAESLIAQAIELLESAPAGRELAWAYRTQAAFRMLDRDTEGATEWGAKAIALAEELGDVEVLAATHNSVGSALLMGGRDGYRHHFDLCIRLGAEHDRPDWVASAHSNFGTGCGELYRFAEAEGGLQRAIALAENHDLDFVRLYSLSWLALVRMYQGAYDEAADVALAVLGRPRASAIARIMSLVALGRMRARRGDPDAWTTLDDALELAEGTGTLQRVGPVRAARAEAAFLAGDPQAARREAAAALELATRARHPWFVGELGYWRSVTGEGRGAAREEGGADGVAAEPFALQLAGRHREAAAAWAALGCPYEAARALSDGGDEADLRTALAGFRSLGARPAGERTIARLRELGVRTGPWSAGKRPATTPVDAALSTREVQVLTLMAAGLRNGEIAEQHGVSVRTVDHQVSSILAKLAVRSRTEAVVEAQRSGLLTATDPPPA